MARHPFRGPFTSLARMNIALMHRQMQKIFGELKQVIEWLTFQTLLANWTVFEGRTMRIGCRQRALMFIICLIIHKIVVPNGKWWRVIVCLYISSSWFCSWPYSCSSVGTQHDQIVLIGLGLPTPRLKTNRGTVIHIQWTIITFQTLVTTRAALAAIIQVSILVLLSPTKFVHMI